MALSVYVLNDVFDIELDSISAEAGNPRHMNRPLVTGKASKSEAKIFVVVQALIGLGVSLLVNLMFFSLLTLYLALGVLYSMPPSHLGKR